MSHDSREKFIEEFGHNVVGCSIVENGMLTFTNTITEEYSIDREFPGMEPFQIFIFIRVDDVSFLDMRQHHKLADINRMVPVHGGYAVSSTRGIILSF